MTTFKDLKKTALYLTKYKISSSTICITALPLTTWILENLSKLIKNHYWSSSQRKNFGSLHNWSEITNSLKLKLEWDRLNKLHFKKISKSMKGLKFEKKIHAPKNILNWISINENFYTCIHFSNLSYRTTKIHFLVLKNRSVINSNFWKIKLTEKYPQREAVCKFCRY